MTDETRDHGRPEADSCHQDAGPDAPRSNYSAAAPPHPGAAGTGETSFGDAEAPGAGASAPPAEKDGAAVEQDLDQLMDKARERDEYLALAQRTQADFENYRKRMARENAQAVQRGVMKVAKELLGALDHLELALKAAEGHEDVVKGFAMVGDELATALERVGVQPFSPQGEAFDPNEHEAMAQQPGGEGVEPGTVIEVYQRGWRVNGAVLRPARVVVAQ